MGSYINFKVNSPQNQINVSKPSITTPLQRQSSIFELTFDEFQNTLGGNGKDFGSMNLDEFLNNIWTAEETQTMATSAVAGNLQRQDSLTLPPILSQKTVDDVWIEMFKENCGGKEVNSPNLQQQQRHPTLGEVTLEEFLSRAGVASETDDDIGFNRNNIVMKNEIMENNFPINTSGMRPSQQLASIGTRGPILGISDYSVKNGLFQGGALGMGALLSGDKQFSPDGDTSARGRKGVSLEKATERRNKRMIKNRESAERSRARKQAYTFELEAEVAKLKEINDELLKKQDEITDMQKNQVQETKQMPPENKKLCLRRTLTGPW